MEILKHLTGMCGEGHLNLTIVLAVIIILKIGYEKIYNLGADK
jgi:hypothetical protein